jgi:hypothetical protein
VTKEELEEQKGQVLRLLEDLRLTPRQRDWLYAQVEAAARRRGLRYALIFSAPDPNPPGPAERTPAHAR